MPANVETMFSVRETPWHGLGRIIMDAPASREALELAGLDWQVESRNIYSGTGAMIPGYRANVRSTDDAVLGVVSDRYRIVQNEEAFQFTDDLLGEGVTYETAGSLQGGKKVWMLARLPRKYLIAGDQVVPYLVIFNSHDGSSGVKVAMTPIRVVCQNTLNLALNTAKRSWTARHTENVLLRVQDARETLQLASNYMVELGNRGEELARIDLSDHKVQEFINEFFPISEDLSDCQRKNNLRLQEELKTRYYNAPDLEWVGKNGWRFINEVSDFCYPRRPSPQDQKLQREPVPAHRRGQPHDRQGLQDGAGSSIKEQAMNDVNNRIFREFTEFFDNVEKSASEISVTMAYEITMKSTISTAIIVLESEGRLEERYWNHLRVQNNILDFLYDLWVGSCHSLASDFSTIMKDLVEYDFIITESIMRERMQSA